MKNLLMGAVVLLLFSFSFLILQTSCSKSDAQPTSSNSSNSSNSLDSVSQKGKIVYAVNLGTPNPQIWTANYDGTNAAQIPLILPPNIKIDTNASYFSIKVSPDGQIIFFSAYDTSNPIYSPAIYSCDISGTNVIEVIPPSAGSPRLGQAY